SYFCGIDISVEAIARADRHRDARIQFQVADVLTYECQRNFDVILFSESIYYIQASRREGLLRRLALNLNPEGCFIVTLSDPDRYADIIRMIKQNFNCLKCGTLNGSMRYLMVFTHCLRQS